MSATCVLIPFLHSSSSHSTCIYNIYVCVCITYKLIFFGWRRWNQPKRQLPTFYWLTPIIHPTPTPKVHSFFPLFHSIFPLPKPLPPWTHRDPKWLQNLKVLVESSHRPMSTWQRPSSLRHHYALLYRHADACLFLSGTFHIILTTCPSLICPSNWILSTWPSFVIHYLPPNHPQVQISSLPHSFLFSTYCLFLLFFVLKKLRMISNSLALAATLAYHYCQKVVILCIFFVSSS